MEKQAIRIRKTNDDGSFSYRTVHAVPGDVAYLCERDEVVEWPVLKADPAPTCGDCPYCDEFNGQGALCCLDIVARRLYELRRSTDAPACRHHPRRRVIERWLRS